MVLVVRGSVCGLCGAVLGEEDDLVMFPAFLKPDHPLYRFSDAVFHARCFAASEDAEAAQALYDRWRAIWATRPLDATSQAEREAWWREAFRDFP